MKKKHKKKEEFGVALNAKKGKSRVQFSLIITLAGYFHIKTSKKILLLSAQKVMPI